MTKVFSKILPGIVAGTMVLSVPALAQPGTIFIGNDREHPESITTASDGSIFIGSWGKSAVYRVRADTGTVEPWITTGLNTVVGVFAHGSALWVCSSAPFGSDGPTFANSYDVATGDLTGSYQFPGGGFCNDFAVGRNGAVFMSDTTNARILVLQPGASELTVFAEDADLLAGVDGLAILDGELVANSVTANRLLMIEIDDDFAFGGITELTLSQPVEGPDGMRTLRTDDGILLVEGDRLVLVTIDGITADIKVIQEGFEGATAVTQAGGFAYVIEAKLAYIFDPDLGDPGEFNAIPVDLGL